MLGAPKASPEIEQLHALAAALAAQAERRRQAPVLRKPAVGMAQQSVTAADQHLQPVAPTTIEIGYRFDRGGACVARWPSTACVREDIEVAACDRPRPSTSRSTA